jgi:uncharacterized membrane protein
MNSIKIYVIILAVMLFIDGIYLGIIQKDYLASKIKEINQDKIVQHPLWSIILTYLIMAFSLYYFVLKDANSKEKSQIFYETVLLAATIYIVFDFSMLNLVSNWYISDAFKDILWGIILFFLTTLITINLI